MTYAEGADPQTNTFAL